MGLPEEVQDYSHVRPFLWELVETGSVLVRFRPSDPDFDDVRREMFEAAEELGADVFFHGSFEFDGPGDQNLVAFHLTDEVVMG